MHSLKLIFALALVLVSSAHAQQALDARYQIRLSINNIAVPGTQELAPKARVEATPGAVYDANPPMRLISGSSFQAVVTVTDPSGQVANYTGSPRLRYETFGCMTASSLGVITVTPMTGVRCDGPEYPGLLIMLLDASGNVITVNSYLFKVVDALVCDVDGDGKVTNADLVLIRGRNGQAATGANDPYDPNHDGKVDLADVRYCQLRLTP